MNINEILKSDYDLLCKDYKKAIKKIEKQDKEIERLNNIIKNYEINTIPTLEHNIDVLVDSEDRLNNIINELEKWLEYQADHTMQQHNYYGVLDKLKELKERK